MSEDLPGRNNSRKYYKIIGQYIIYYKSHKTHRHKMMHVLDAKVLNCFFSKCIHTQEYKKTISLLLVILIEIFLNAYHENFMF